MIQFLAVRHMGEPHGREKRMAKSKEGLRKRAFGLRRQGATYAIMSKALKIPYSTAKRLGKLYDEKYGAPKVLVRQLDHLDEDSGVAKARASPSLTSDMAIAGPGVEELRKQAFELREKGCTYALIEKKLGIHYRQAKQFGKEYDALHGRPTSIIRNLAEETLGTGPISIPVRDLRNDSARILRQVETGRRFLITVSGHEVAELVPVVSRSVFVPRSIIERIIREAPLDHGFAGDIEAAAGQRVDEL